MLILGEKKGGVMLGNALRAYQMYYFFVSLTFGWGSRRQVIVVLLSLN